MKTHILNQSDPLSIRETHRILKSGGVVAIPTDTVYGIACAYDNSEAIRSLYRIKVRDNLKAIPILLSDISQMPMVAENLNTKARILAETFWPGALTLIVQKKEGLPSNLTNYPTVGIRIPDYDWLRTIMRTCGPLSTTSANISGKESPRNADQVFEQLNGRIELIIDGGECKGGVSSTVVDCSTDKIKIIRAGGISISQIQTAIENFKGAINV